MPRGRLRACLGFGLVVLVLVARPSPSIAAWTYPGVVVCDQSADRYWTQVVAGVAEDCFIARTETRPEESTEAHVYVSRILSDGSIAPGWPSCGLRVDTASTYSGWSRIAQDGAGGVYLVWQDATEEFTGGPARARLARIRPEGVAHPSIPLGGVLLGPMNRSRHFPSIAISRDGGVFIAAASRLEMGVETVMLLAKFDSTGAIWPGWPADGLALDEPPGEKLQSAVVPDEAGGALVAWYASGSIYAHRVLTGGSVDAAWPAAGRELLRNVPAGQYSLFAIPDGAGGMIVSYGDSLGAVDSTGAIRPGWPPAGTRGEPEPPRVASDGSPGAYVLSQRVVRRYSQTLYTRGAVLGRYDLSGAPSPGWPDTGRVIYESVLGYGQYPAELLASRQGIYAIWGDAGEPRGLRGLRLTPDGQVAPGWPSTPPVVTTRVLSSHSSTLLPSDDAVIAWSGTIYDGGNTSTEDTLFVQRLGVDGPVPTLASVASAGVAGDLATIEWWVVDAPPTPLRVERSGDGAAWEPAGTAEAVGGDRVRFRESGLRPGERRAYRLTWMESGAPRTAGLVWVARPANGALRVVSGRFARGPERIVLGLSLPTADPLRVQVLDVQGRMLLEQRIVPRDAGEQTIDLATRRSAPGLHLVRVTQAGGEATGRVVVTR